MQFAGKVAVVTGGAVRLGRAISLALAEHGVRVCVHFGHSRDEAAEVVGSIQSRGGQACSVQADLNQSSEAADEVFDHARQVFGQVDILVNSAAIFEAAQFTATTPADWETHFGINLKAAFFLCRRFATQQPAIEGGHIVNIVDWRALRPQRDHIVYTMTKAGLVTLTQSLAQELAPRIQVNAIAPGAILPPPGKDKAYLASLAERIPLRRTGSPKDVTEALMYLLHSDFITGEVLRVSGGEEL